RLPYSCSVPTAIPPTATLLLLLPCYPPLLDLHSFPTRRSSDLNYDNSRTNGHATALLVPSDSDRLLYYHYNIKQKSDRPCRYLRSEEHTSELQSRFDLVCRLLLEKKK